MAQVVIRNIDEDVLDRLRTRARAERKSLEQSLREILGAAARPSREELVAEMEAIREATRRRGRGRRYPSAEDLIREDRDRR